MALSVRYIRIIPNVWKKKGRFSVLLFCILVGYLFVCFTFYAFVDWYQRGNDMYKDDESFDIADSERPEK